jgi:hypothetical protein
MLKSRTIKKIALLSLIFVTVASLLANPASALVSQSVQWFTGSDTRVSSVAIGDVNNDGQNEIVTVGYCNNGLLWKTELYVRSATMGVIGYTSWSSVADTQINSVAIGDVNGVAGNEIVTAGSYFDGVRWNSQLIVWNGATANLQVLGYAAWNSVGNTQIASVAIGDVNGVAGNEIVTGGAYFNGNWFSQLIVWNGATANLQVLGYAAWNSVGNTQINSVAIGDVNGVAGNEVVTGGAYFNGNWFSQLIVWNAAIASPTVLAYTAWNSVGNTQINSVAIGDVNGVAGNEVVTAGQYFDNVSWNAQLIVWNAAIASPSVLGYAAWNTVGDTRLTSVSLGNFVGGTGLDIFTSGTFFDGSRTNAQLSDFIGTTLALRSAASWFTTSNTEVASVAFGNLNGANRIVTGGSLYDNIRSNSQLATWT